LPPEPSQEEIDTLMAALEEDLGQAAPGLGAGQGTGLIRGTGVALGGS
jgi:hypothetical protein